MEEENNSTLVIDIEKLQNSLGNNLDPHCTSLCNFNIDSKATSSCKIQKLLHEVYKSDYEPVLVSIGPYHRNERLQDVEKLKWKSLEYVLKTNPDKTLHDYIEALWELYPVARNYYPKDAMIHDTKFVHVLLLDGCFIITYIISGFEGSSSNNPNLVSDENPDKHKDPLESSIVTRDFLLIENQIPFFIVKRIYELLSSKQSINALPLEKFAKFFEQIFPDNSKPIVKLERPRVIYHLLHLCHMYLRPSSNEDFCDQQLDYNNSGPSQ